MLAGGNIETARWVFLVFLNSGAHNTVLTQQVFVTMFRCAACQSNVVGTCGDPAASSGLAEAVCQKPVSVGPVRKDNSSYSTTAQSSAGPPLLHPSGAPVSLEGWSTGAALHLGCMRA